MKSSIYREEIEKLEKKIEETIQNKKLKNALKDRLQIKLDREERKLLHNFLNHCDEEQETKCLAFLGARRMIEYFRDNDLKPEGREKFEQYIQITGVDFYLPYLPSKITFTHLVAQIPTSGTSVFLEVLQENNADFTAYTGGNFLNTPLIWAVANANNENATYMLDLAAQRGIDLGINLADRKLNSGNTALHLAVAKGYIDQDSAGRQLAVSNLQLVEKLLQNGADPNLRNALGYSALDIAVIRGDEDLVRTICHSNILTNQTINLTEQMMRGQYWSSANASHCLSRITPHETFLEPTENFTQEKQEKFLEIIGRRTLGPTGKTEPTDVTKGTDLQAHKSVIHLCN